MSEISRNACRSTEKACTGGGGIYDLLAESMNFPGTHRTALELHALPTCMDIMVFPRVRFILPRFACVRSDLTVVTRTSGSAEVADD